MMIGIDENILFKFITGDQSKAFRPTRDIIIETAAKGEVFISLALVLEVSRLFQGYQKEKVIEAMLTMTRVAGFSVESPETLTDALEMWAEMHHLSLKDCLLAAIAGAAGADHYYTERKELVKHSHGILAPPDSEK